MRSFIKKTGRFVTNLCMNPFASAIAIWAIIQLTRAIEDPGSTAASGLIPNALFYSWAGSYALGGVFLLLGQGLRSPRVMSVGCILYAEGALVNALAIFFNPVDSFWPGVQGILFGVAALVRFRHLIRGELLTWVSSTLSFRR